MNSRYQVVIFLAIQAVVLSVAVAVVPARIVRLRPGAILPDIRSEPLRIVPKYDCPQIVSDDQLLQVLERLKPRFSGERPRINHVDHALRFWGVNASFTDKACISGASMRELLTNHRQFVTAWGGSSQPLLIHDGSDVQVRVGGGRSTSSHVDHTLASLAEVGTPIDFPIFTSLGETDLRAMLESSLREFSLNQVEHEWSALAYVLFLPPTTVWTSKEGQAITFDRLAERAMRQELPLGVCFGNHRIYELAAMLQVDEHHKILSDSMKVQILDHLRAITAQLVKTQAAEGFWDGQWAGKTLRSSDASVANSGLTARVLATGHALEWWAIAPETLHPPASVTESAGRWLVKTILEMKDNDISEYYPFLSHAGRALALWRSREPADVIAASQAREAQTNETP